MAYEAGFLFVLYESLPILDGRTFGLRFVLVRLNRYFCSSSSVREIWLRNYYIDSPLLTGSRLHIDAVRVCGGTLRHRAVGIFLRSCGRVGAFHRLLSERGRIQKQQAA